MNAPSHRFASSRTASRALGVLAACALAACGGSESTSRDTAAPTVREARALWCTPADRTGACILDFGLAAPSRKLELRNESTRPHVVEIASIEQDHSEIAFFLGKPVASWSLPGGGTVEIELGFEGKTCRLYSATLHLRSDDPEAPALDVAMSGFGCGPTLGSPREVEFGALTDSESTEQVITIQNTGADVAEREDDLLRFGYEASGTWVPAPPEIVGSADFTLRLPFEWPQGIAAGGLLNLAVRFAPGALGARQATLRIRSNDPRAPVFDVALTGTGITLQPCRYEVRPRTVSFGTLEPGRTATVAFAIINTSADVSAACEIADLHVEPEASPVTLVNRPTAQTRILGGQQLSVPLRVTASSPESDLSAHVRFRVSGQNEAVAVQGQVRAGTCLLTSPRTLSFDAVEVGCAAREASIGVYNTCTAPIALASVMLSSSSSTFAIYDLPEFPIVIEPGAWVGIGVRYRPQHLGEDSATVSLSIQGDPSQYLVAVTGHGSGPMTWTDRFTAAVAPQTDFLLVLDDSPAMADKVSMRAAQLGLLFDTIDRSWLDYHVGVTTTSVGPGTPDGWLLPLTGSGPTFITRTTPNRSQAFASNAFVGTSGTAVNALEAVSRALRPGVLHNSGFRRPWAPLQIVFVTASEDVSPETADSYAMTLILLGARRTSGAIPMASSPPAGCSYSGATAGQSTRLSQIITYSFGVAAEICSPDWASQLSSIAATSFRPDASFRLSRTPVSNEGALVTIDGTNYPQHDASGAVQWQIPPDVAVIQFTPGHEPPTGSVVAVVYHVACL